MKHHLKKAPWVLMSALLALFSCNDPTVIGSDLLSGDELDIQFTDTLTLTGYTLKEDSVKTYDPDAFSSDFESFHSAALLDPVFGQSVSTIFAQFNLNTSDPFFLDGELDSIVLVLPYDANRSYGKLDETFSLEIFELEESLHDTATYYSNQSFLSKSSPIGFADYQPKPNDSIEVLVPVSDSLVARVFAPHLRIRLDEAFSNAFFQADTSNFNENDDFLSFFKGLEIRPVSVNGGMVSFKMRNALTGIWVFYREGSKHKSYQFPIFSGNVVTAHFDHDYENSVAGNFLPEGGGTPDSLYFLQGLSGLNFNLEIPYATTFEDIVVNRAEIILPVVKLAEDGTDLSPAEQIVVYEVIDDSTFQLIDDVEIALLARGNDFEELFGGDLLTDDTYKINITAHFQDMVRGTAGKTLQVRIYQKPERASRVVLAGPRLEAIRPKLNLSYTRY